MLNIHKNNLIIFHSLKPEVSKSRPRLQNGQGKQRTQAAGDLRYIELLRPDELAAYRIMSGLMYRDWVSDAAWKRVIFGKDLKLRVKTRGL